jgi:hypothetical protein
LVKQSALEAKCGRVLVWLAPPDAFDEAEQLYRRAIDAGEETAISRLADLLVGCGRLDEAEDCYRRSIDAGNAWACTGLARLLIRLDPGALSGLGVHAERVRELLERSALAGDTQALTLLGTQAAELGSALDAQRYLGWAAASEMHRPAPCCSFS